MVIREDAVLAAVKNVIQLFRQNPYQFLYESDLQATLFGQLRARIGDSVQVKGSGGPRVAYEIGAVYTEYANRIDIACLDLEAVQRMDEPSPYKGFDTHIYNLPVDVGIEVKYRKMGDVNLGIAACVADLKKLRDFRVSRPLALGFIQDRRDEKAFFSQGVGGGEQQEVADITEFDSIYVVSPESVWRCTESPRAGRSDEPAR